jgi:hypothetical protein
VAQYWGGCESVLEGSEGIIASRQPFPWDVLVCKTSKWDGDAGVGGNKLAVEICEAKEGLDILDFAGHWPVADDLDL